MVHQKLIGHVILVWHAVIGRNGVISGHADILRFSRPLTPEEETEFRGRCRTMLGSVPITTERFDAEMESICTRFENEFDVEIAMLEPATSSAVVVSAKEPAIKRDSTAVRTAILAMDGQGPGDYPSEKKTRGRRKNHG